MHQKINLRDWSWVAFPILAAAFILISYNFLTNLPTQQIDDVVRAQQEIESEEQVVARLRQKVSLLEKLSGQNQSEDLLTMTAAVPPSKKMWLLLSGIRQAAGVSGSTLVSYNAVVGDIREATMAAKQDDNMTLNVTLKIDDFMQIASLAANLENQIPLVKVNKVEFSETDAQLLIEGAWSPWGKTAANPENTIADYRGPLNVVKQKISGYQANTVPVRSEIATMSASTTSPF